MSVPMGGVSSSPLNCHALIIHDIFYGEKFPFSKTKQHEVNNRKVEQLLCAHLQVEEGMGMTATVKLNK
jgi:hypothetical protein